MDPSRRQFLRGCSPRESQPIPRPPWAIQEAAFAHACSRCNACIQSCPYRLLIRGDGGYPQIDFRRGGCDFCEACAEACEDGALRLTDSVTTLPWRARIGDACLARRGVVCRSCAEACDSAAIRIRPRIGGVALPELDEEVCNGCGACFHDCPTRAITMVPSPADTP